MNKYIFILSIASSLCISKSSMTIPQLADLLNQNGFTTSYGTLYQGGRGTYRLISVTYDWLVLDGKQTEADKVAKAFTKPDGSYAY